MSDEQFFLANAYLDGELTDEERRIAEADPAVMAEVESLRALQAEVRDLDPPSDAAREAAISAAMAAFDVAPTAAAASTSIDDATGTAPQDAAPVVPFRPRPAYAKYLGYAAAVVAVIGLGVVVSRIELSGNDDDSATDAIPADDAGADVAAEAPLIESVEEATAERAGDDEMAEEMADDGGDDTADGGDDTDAAADDAGGDDAGVDGATTNAGAGEGDAEADFADSGEMSDEDTGDGDAPAATFPVAAPVTIPSDYDPDRFLETPDDLALRGAFLVRERDAARLEPSPNSNCVRDDETLARARLVRDDEVVPVLVAVDEIDRLVSAIDDASCVELVVAPLPDVVP